MERSDHDLSPEFVTIPEAARRLGLGRRQIQRAIDGGRVEEFRVGGWPRVRLDDVRSWVLSTAAGRDRKGAR